MLSLEHTRDRCPASALSPPDAARSLFLVLPGQIYGEDASLAGKVPHPDSAAAFFDALAADRQPKSEARSVRASLFEQTKQMLDLPRREAAAFILDLDLDPIRGREGFQRYLPGGRRELERVLNQVR